MGSCETVQKISETQTVPIEIDLFCMQFACCWCHTILQRRSEPLLLSHVYGVMSISAVGPKVSSEARMLGSRLMQKSWRYVLKPGMYAQPHFANLERVR